MKLNIEELAREAGIEFDPRWGIGTVGNKQIERLALLIVERCAQEADDLTGHLLAFHDRKGAEIAASLRDSIRKFMES